MKDIKNYIIALLAGLLVLSISIQPSQGAGTSASAKAIQYDHCMNGYSGGETGVYVAIQACKAFQP